METAGKPFFNPSQVIVSKSGIIKSSSSTVGGFSSVEDWQGSGPYTSEIEHGITLSVGDEVVVSCFIASVKIEPISIESISTTVVKITSSTNSDMRVVIVA